MAFKKFALNDTTSVTIYKRKASRSLRLSISSKGEVRVSIPAWTPYLAGLQFAKSRADWIESQRKPASVLISGQAVGKAHHLSFLPSSGASKVTSRVIASGIFIKYPANMSSSDPAVQAVVEKASIRALRTQAEKLLPQRLKTLAAKYDFEYNDVAIKQLKSRWGSCDQQKHIVLNLFLMQLPWELIDYVILHELTHTRHLHHGPKFWGDMENILPHIKDYRRAMRGHQPVLAGSLAS